MQRAAQVFYYRQFGRLLSYPAFDYFDQVRWLFEQCGHDREKFSDPAVVDQLSRFFDSIEGLAQGELEELFTATFDLAPACTPYLGVHLFGESDFRRSELMCELISVYELHGFDAGGELPDHLAVLMRSAFVFSPEQWDELVRRCLLPAVRKMVEILSSQNNPYRFLLSAVETLLRVGSTAELVGIGDA